MLAAGLAFGPARDARAELTRIGAAGGVSGKVSALAPEQGAAGRPLSSGKTVYHKDKVVSGAQGRLQVLLLDESTFTVGPDTELILDEFVYDPFSGEGKVSAELGKGVLKFVSGRIARKQPENMRIKLPVGTLGIRGTIGAISTDGNSAVIALLGPGDANDSGERAGALSVTNAGVTVEITRPGYATEIAGPDAPPTPPAPLTPEQQAQLTPTPKAEADKEEAGSAAGAAEGGSAGDEAGATTTEARGDLSSTQQGETLAQTFSGDAAAASQDAAETGIVDGISKYSDLRTLTTGDGYYSGSGAMSMTCTSCSGSFSYTITIDFANRRFGGTVNGTPSSLSASCSGTGCNAGGSSDSVSFPSAGVDFSSGSDEATKSFVGSGSIITGSYSLMNSGGVPAKELRLQLNYNDPGTGDGSAAHTSQFVSGVPPG